MKNNDRSIVVSAIMPTYNNASYIKGAIESILNQTLPEFELVIVNDGSTDNTNDVVRSIKDDRIKYYELERNMGRGYARNYAISKCTGSYIAVCDADDLSLPDRFAKQVKFLEANKEIDILGTQILHFSDGKTPSKVYHYPEEPEALSSYYEKGIMGIAHCSCMLRRNCFDKNSYENSFAYIEDLELFIRLNSGHKMSSLSEPLIYYRNNNLEGLKFQDLKNFKLYHRFSIYTAKAKLNHEERNDFEDWAKPLSRKIGFQLVCAADYFKIRVKVLLIGLRNLIPGTKK